MNIQNIKTILITVIIVIAVWFFKDYPHFQISNRQTWRTLKLKLDCCSFIVDKGIKYVKI